MRLGWTSMKQWTILMVIPSKSIRCLIWCQYIYHVDRKMDFSPKLEAWWARQKSQVYLAFHSAGLLTVVTQKISWKALETEEALDREWTTIGPKSRSKKANAISADSKNSGTPIPIHTIDGNEDLDSQDASQSKAQLPKKLNNS